MDTSRSDLETKFHNLSKFRDRNSRGLAKVLFSGSELIYCPLPGKGVSAYVDLSHFVERLQDGHCVIFSNCDSLRDKLARNFSGLRRGLTFVQSGMQESELSAIKQVVDDQERLLFVIKDDFYGPISKEADELFDSISNSVIKAEFTLNPVRYFNESASTPSKCSLGHDNLNFYGGFAEERKIVIYQAERVEKNERAFRISSGETVTLFSVKKGSSKAGELLQSGLFDFIHFGKRFDKTVETGFISARLLEFFRLLKEMESREVFVYATEAEMRILWQILKHRVEGTFDSTQWRITAGTFKNYKDIKVNLVLTSSVSQLHRLGRQAKVILFSRVYVHLRAQLFLMLSPDQKDELDQFCSYEHKLAEGQQKKQDVLSRLKCILVDTDGFSNNCFFCSDSEVVQFYAFVEETKQALLRSPLVEGVELFNNNFFVTARTSSRCAVKSVFGACRFPVEYPVRPAVLNATVLTDSVEIGTVVNYYQFIGGMKFEVEVESDGSNSNNSNKGSNKDDSNKGSNNYDNSNNNDNYDSDISDYRINLLSSNNHSKPCSKFITEFSSNEITIFFRNYMIQIRRSSVEKIIAEYDRIDADGHVDVYVLLKTLPRVYSCQDVKYATVCMKYQNMAQLKLARWDRCTREEIDWFERRGDIKFTVQLDQSGVGSAPNEVNFVDVSPSSVLEHLVAQLAKFYPVVHYSEVREPRDSSLSFLDSSQIVAYFTALLDFASLYHVLVLVSWKARFLTDVFTEGDLAYIADNTDVGDFCRHLERRLSHRLDKINLRKAVVEFRQIRPNRFRPKRDHSTTVEIRSVLVTPLRTFYNWEQPNDTNRVLRNFEPDRFLRVSLREDEDTKFQNDLARGQEAVYDFFRRTLLDGMFVGPRKYFFLVMTAAQMSAHNAWFISTLIAGRRVIGADYVRGWLGDFRKIKNIGKYAVRIGQAFSATKEAVGVDRVVVLGDVVRNGYVFTDGAGVITRQLGRGIAESLGLNYVPSAYQIRFGGAKGVVTVQPDEVVEKILVEGNSSNSSNNSSKGDNNSSKDNSNSSKDSSKGNNINKGDNKSNNNKGNNKGGNNSSKVNNSSKGNNDSNNSNNNYNYYNNKGNNNSGKVNDYNLIILRESMVKFDSSHSVVEVCQAAKSHEFFLNRQFIVILEGLGIPAATFIRLQDQYARSILRHAVCDPVGLANRHLCFATAAVTNSLLFGVTNGLLAEISSKARIRVEDGRTAMGVIDERGLLEPDEVFIMFQGSSSGCTAYGDFVVPTGVAIVAKNPCMHPGDIRIVKCVDRPGLHHLKDVLVFSQRGARPLFNECSGSDLDGDVYAISWCHALVPRMTFRPYQYGASGGLGLLKSNILNKDVVNFFIRHMRTHQLGLISNAHLAFADRHSVFHPATLRLSELFNRSIDFVKTGSTASISAELHPAEYPDFMEAAPGYVSEKALGRLYRRARFHQRHGSCECHGCFIDSLAAVDEPMRTILRGSRPLVEFGRDEEADPMELLLLSDYKAEIRLLIHRHRVASEEELFMSRETGVIREMRAVVSKYRGIASGMRAGASDRVCTRESGMFSSIIRVKPAIHRRREYRSKGVIGKYSEKYFSCYFNSNILIDDQGGVTNVDVDQNINNNDIDHNNDDIDQNVNIDQNDDTNINIDQCKRNCSKTAIYTRLDDNFILVKADYQRMAHLVDQLGPKRRDLFSDAFNLLLLTGAYSLNEMDRITNILLYINNEMDRVEPDRSVPPEKEEVFKFIDVSFALSNDALFRVAFVVGLDVSLFRKIGMARGVELKTGQRRRSHRVCKEIDMVVHGMLDDEDEVEFVGDSACAGIRLKNRGYCEFNYHREHVRDFILNGFYAPSNILVVRQWKKSVCYRVSFEPGRLNLSRIPGRVFNSSMKIKEVVEEVAAGKVDVLFESSLREMDAGEKTRRIQVCYERRTYWIEYVDEIGKRVVKRISRSRESLGKMYVVNRLNSFMDPGVPERSDKLDYTVELTREKLLYSGEMEEMGEMGEKEGRRLKEWIESGGERDERIVVEEVVEREQLEMSVVEKVVDGPEVGLTKFYYEQSWISNEDNLSAFDRIFSSLWKQYSKW